jgi:hypothetical protein
MCTGKDIDENSLPGPNEEGRFPNSLSVMLKETVE